MWFWLRFSALEQRKKFSLKEIILLVFFILNLNIGLGERKIVCLISKQEGIYIDKFYKVIHVIWFWHWFCPNKSKIKVGIRLKFQSSKYYEQVISYDLPYFISFIIYLIFLILNFNSFSADAASLLLSCIVIGFHLVL